MNPKNDYLDYEIRKLKLDVTKAKSKGDNQMLLKFLCVLIPLLCIGISLHAAPKCPLQHRYVRQVDGGVQFTCKRCRTNQWQDRNQADWAGNFYCRACGTRMGTE